MSDVSLKVVSILAEGYSKSHLTFVNPLTGQIRTMLIPRELYYDLKELGVPTGQKLSRIRVKNNNK